MPGRDTAPGFLLRGLSSATKWSAIFGETNPRCENATTGGAALRSTSRPGDVLYFPCIQQGSTDRARGRVCSDVFVHGAAGHDGAHHATLEPGLVERRVLAFRLELGGVQNPGGVEVDHDDIGRASLP